MRTWKLGLLAAGLLVGCSSSRAGMDASPSRPPIDAAPIDAVPPTLAEGGACDGPLELGRCELSTGGPCTGVPGEPAGFVAVAPGGTVPVVVGPQASSMVVLAARTRGIAPGDPASPASSANPTVEIHLLDAAGAELAAYRGRAAFVADPSDPTLLVQPAFFVIVDGALSSLTGTLVAQATLRDAAGVTRCGVLTFLPVR